MGENMRARRPTIGLTVVALEWTGRQRGKWMPWQLCRGPQPHGQKQQDLESHRPYSSPRSSNSEAAVKRTQDLISGHE